MLKPISHLFVCGAIPSSEAEACQCDSLAAQELVLYLRQELKKREMHRVMVTACECMDHCEDNPIVMVYPEGFWYRQVNEESADKILDFVRNTALHKSSSGCVGCHK